MPFLSSGGRGGLLIPDSAAIPFADNAARDAWASSNLGDLINDTTAVNVTGQSWFIWRGETNPESYDSTLWVNGDEIVKGKDGAKGATGDKGDTVKISSIENELDHDGKLKTTVSLDDGTSAESTPLQLPKGAEINVNGEAVGAIYTESSIDTLIENGEATLSVNNRISNWSVHAVGIGDSPYIIDKVEQLGIEYQYAASSDLSQSMQLYTAGLPDGAQVKVLVTDITKTSKPINVFQITATGTFNWPVVTPTVFTLRSGLWRVEESSQMLHVEGSTTYDGDGANKTLIHGIAVDPSSDLTAAVSEDGLLVLGRTYTPPTDTVDIAFWWTNNAQPDSSDILNAMSQVQTSGIISHTDNFYRDDLQKRTLTAKREENSFKYLFFAWHKGFFNPEPTKVDTGWGAPSTWLETEVDIDGEIYKVLTVEVKNNTKLVEDYALVQEGIR